MWWYFGNEAVILCIEDIIIFIPKKKGGLRGLGFNLSESYQYFWLSKNDEYGGYEKFATNVDDVIIAAKIFENYSHWNYRPWWSH